MPIKTVFLSAKTLAAWQIAAANAAFNSAASQFAVGTINGKGNIAAGLKNTLSKDGLKNIASAGLTAGLPAGVVNPALGIDASTSFNLTNLADIQKFAL